jgi:hypothetical protein
LGRTTNPWVCRALFYHAQQTIFSNVRWHS